MVTKKQINISFDNQYEGEASVLYDGLVIEKFAKEITSFYLTQREVYEKSVLKEFEFTDLSFEIIFVSDNYIHEINREYRGKDKPTDVITFALFADSEPKFVLDGEISLGEIIVSIDTIVNQAKEIGNDFKNELYYIISHGILHLIGFDHLSDDEYNFMVEWQKKSLKEIDV